MTNAFLTPAGPGAFRTLSPLVLGSNSPRRRELLGSLGLEFEICPSNAQEPAPEDGEPAEAYARRMARLKTSDVAVLYPDAAVLGADTIVVLPAAAGAARPDIILGKPRDEADALRMLGLLSGRGHTVITGVCLCLPGGGEPICLAVATEVFMRASSRAELAAYAATREPADKAGAYAIQGLGAFLVQRVAGSYTNVVGLPVAECAALLLEHGVIAARPAHGAERP